MKDQTFLSKTNKYQRKTVFLPSHGRITRVFRNTFSLVRLSKIAFVLYKHKNDRKQPFTVAASYNYHGGISYRRLTLFSLIHHYYSLNDVSFYQI